MALYLMLFQTAIFLTIWAAIHSYVTRYGPIPKAHSIALLNNRLYSLASIFQFVLILSPYEETAKQLYHASKFYEYIDILAVRASGGNIDLHFGFHHLTTPYLTYFRVLQNSHGWRVMAGLNAFHHTIMYAYFGGAGFLRAALPVTGSLQLVVGLVGEGLILSRKKATGELPQWPNLFVLNLLSIYLVLWIRELRMKARHKHLA